MLYGLLTSCTCKSQRRTWIFLLNHCRYIKYEVHNSCYMPYQWPWFVHSQFCSVTFAKVEKMKRNHPVIYIGKGELEDYTVLEWLEAYKHRCNSCQSYFPNQAAWNQAVAIHKTLNNEFEFLLPHQCVMIEVHINSFEHCSGPDHDLRIHSQLYSRMVKGIAQLRRASS